MPTYELDCPTHMGNSTGETVTAALLNTHVRDNLKAIGRWDPGDLKITYRTHANATSTTLTEETTGWYIANGATFSSGSHPTLYTNIGSTTTLPDYRGRMFVAPGTQDGHSFTRGETGGVYDADVSISVSGTVASTGFTVTGAPGSTTASFDQDSPDNPALTSVSLGTLDVGGSSSFSDTDTDTPVTMSPYRVGGMVLVKNDN